MLAEAPDGSSRVTSRASGPSTRLARAAAPMGRRSQRPWGEHREPPVRWTARLGSGSWDDSRQQGAVRTRHSKVARNVSISGCETATERSKQRILKIVDIMF